MTSAIPTAASATPLSTVNRVSDARTADGDSRARGPVPSARRFDIREPEPSRDRDRLQLGMGVELHQQRLDVPPAGGQRDTELTGDLPSVVTDHHHRQHVPLPTAEPRQRTLGPDGTGD